MTIDKTIADSLSSDAALPNGMRHCYVGVSFSGALLAGGTAYAMDVVSGVLVAMGSLVGLLILWTIDRTVRTLLSGVLQVPWVVVSVVKYLALLFGAYLLLQRGDVPLLPVVAGYAALPLGIVLGQLGQPLSVPTETES